MKRLQNSFRRLALLCAVLCLFGALLSVQGLAADLTVEGGSSYGVYLSVTATNGYSASNGSCSLTGNVMTITATGYTYFLNGRKTTTTVTVTSSYPGTMTIPYTCTDGPTISVSNNGVNSGGVITLNGAGESFTVSLESPAGKNKTNTATFTFGTIGYSELTPYVTFQRPTNGSYTVSYDCSQEVEPYSTFNYSNARTYDLYATPDAGYEFLAWMDDTGAVLSEQPEFYYRAASDTTISAVFIPAGCARFYVMGNPSKLYYYLDEASSAAGSNGVIIAKTDGKICFSGDQTSFTLPGGQTLIVPHGSNVTSINGSSDKHPYACETLVLASVKRSTLADPETNAYITLTLPAGHTLTVNGKLAVGGTMNGAGGIVSEWLEENSDTTQQVYHSNICLENSARLAVNGKLSSCGFIYGEGTVEANSGAEVYVPFSILDYRGGGFVVGAAGQSQGYGITPVTSESSLSPLAHYTANAIQARQQIAYNAKVIGYVDLFTTGSFLGGHHCDNATLIGPSDALLILGTGSSATITYDGSVYAESYPAIGKTKIVVDGNASFGYLTLTVSVGTDISVTTNGVNFPLPYNFEIELASGCFDLSHSLSIFPGAKVTVGEQATLEVNSSLTVYDGLHDYSTAGSESTDKKFFHFDFFSDTNIEISDVYNASTNPNGTWMYQPSSLPYPNTAELQKSSFGGSGAADLIVNGTMELKSGATFGGIVQTAASDATVIVEPGVTLSTSTQVGLIGTYRALIKGFSFVGATTRTLTGQILDTGTGAKTDMAAGKTYHSSTGSDRVDSYTYDVYYAYEPSSGNSQEKKTSKQITEPVNMVLQGSWYNYTVLIHVVDEEGTEYDTIEMKFAHGASVAGMGYYSDLSLQTEVTTIQNGNDLYYRGEPEVKVVSSADGSETNYLKVRAAVQAAGSSGDRVVLLRDLEGFDSSVIAGQGQDLIFDLNGHRLSYKGTPFFAAAGGTLTVDLNGGTLTNTVDGVSYHCAPFAVTAGGTLTVLLNGGSIAVDAGDERVHTGAVNYGSMTVDLGSSGGSWSYTTGLTAGSAAYKGSAALINEGTMTITGSANAELSGKITSDALSTASGVDGAAVVRNGTGGSLTLSGGRLEHVNTTSGDNSYGLLNLGTVLSVTNTKITVLNGAAVRNNSLIETIGAGNYFRAPKQTLYNVGTITTIDSKIESDSATLTRIISTNGAALYNSYQSGTGAGAIGTIKNVYIEASGSQGIYNGGSVDYHPVIDEIGAGTEVYCKTGDKRPAILNSASSIIREISGGIYRSDSYCAIGNLNTSEPIELSGGDFRQKNGVVLFYEIDGNNYITYAANKALSVLTRTPPDAVVIDVSVGGFSYVTNLYTVTFEDPVGYMDPAPAPVPVEDGQCVTKPDSMPEPEETYVYEWRLNGKAYDFASPVTKNITLTLVYYRPYLARVTSANDPTSSYEYYDVQEALNMAQNDDTVTLLADVTGQYTIGEGKKLTLDLNGYTLTNNGNVITNNGDLTLNLNYGEIVCATGASSASAEYNGMAAVDNSGTLTINGPGSVRADALAYSNAAKDFSAAIRNGGTLTMQNGVEARGVTSGSSGYLAGVVNHTNGTITTIFDGVYEGRIAGVFNNKTLQEIRGGTFIGNTTLGGAYFTNYPTTLKGGLYKNTVSTAPNKAVYDYNNPDRIAYETANHTLSKAPNAEGYYYITAYYDVSFDVREHGEAPAQLSDVETGSKLIEPAPPTETGYRFDGWYKDASCTVEWDFDADTVTADTVLYAKWTALYTVTWINGDTTLETDEDVPDGTAPSYDSAEPAKAATAQYTYAFAGWAAAADQESGTAEESLPAVSGDVSYYAAFSKTVNEYTVIWKNYDGTTLRTDENLPYGTAPSYDGAEPTKAATAQYTYAFAGWSTDGVTVIENGLPAATGDATYIAVFTQAPSAAKLVPASGGNGSYYATVKAAVEAVSNAGDRVVLLAVPDAAELPLHGTANGYILDLNGLTISSGTAETLVRVAANTSLTLDLNGGTLEHHNTGEVEHVGATVVDNYGTLTVQDSRKDETDGLITTDAYSDSAGNGLADLVSALRNRSGATLTVTGGRFETTESQNFNAAAVLNLTGGKVELISGGSFTTGTQGYGLVNKATVERISGGEFTGSSAAVYNLDKSAKIGEISGDCSFTSAKYALQNNGTVQSISGGSFTSEGTDTNCYALYNTGTVDGISGGSFTSKSHTLHNTDTIGSISGDCSFTSNGTGYALNNSGTVESISGGSFTAASNALNNSGTVQSISGGSFRATNTSSYHALNNSGTVESISGGSFSGRSAVYTYNQGRIGSISGGEFHATIQIVINVQSSRGIGSISGGIFWNTRTESIGNENCSVYNCKGPELPITGGYFQSNFNNTKLLFTGPNGNGFSFPAGTTLSTTTTTAPNGVESCYFIAATVTYAQRTADDILAASTEEFPVGELRALKTVEELGLTVPEGYVFQQWSGSNDRSYADGESAIFYESVTLTAQWAPAGGSSVESPVTINWYDGYTNQLLRTDYLESIEDLTQPILPTHAGMKFEKWEVTADSTWLFDVGESGITRNLLIDFIRETVKFSGTGTIDIVAKYGDTESVDVTVNYQLGDGATAPVASDSVTIKGFPSTMTEGTFQVSIGRFAHLIAVREFTEDETTYVFSHWEYYLTTVDESGNETDSEPVRVDNPDILIRPQTKLTLTAVYEVGESSENNEPEIVCFVSDVFSETVNGATRIGATMSFSVPDDGTYIVLRAGLRYSRNLEDFSNGKATLKSGIPDSTYGTFTQRIASKSNTYNFYFQGYLKYSDADGEHEVYSPIVGPYDWGDPFPPVVEQNAADEPDVSGHSLTEPKSAGTSTEAAFETQEIREPDEVPPSEPESAFSQIAEEPEAERIESEAVNDEAIQKTDPDY